MNEPRNNYVVGVPSVMSLAWSSPYIHMPSMLHALIIKLNNDPTSLVTLIGSNILHLDCTRILAENFDWIMPERN